MTFKRPKLEVAARNQFLPDLINLKRVTRSVSRNSPFERLKNMLSPYLHFLLPYYYRLPWRFLEAIIISYCYFFIILPLISNEIAFIVVFLSNRGKFLKKMSFLTDEKKDWKNDFQSLLNYIQIPV